MIAFYHDVETASGIITKYHKITYFALEYSANKVTQMLIDSWVNKEAHDNGKYSLHRDCVYLPATPPDDLPAKELFNWGYEQLISPQYANSYNVHKYTGCIKDENYNGN